MFARLSLAILASAAYAAAGCENLAMLKLEKGSVTSTVNVEAGAFTPPGGQAGANSFQKLPAFCRVQATLTPTSDSHIEMELWMPAANWNGKFLALGNGGWAGSITGALATALARGYATASNDTGHKGGSASFAGDHPEKLVDFGYRAMHEMAMQSKTMSQTFYSRGPQLAVFTQKRYGGLIMFLTKSSILTLAAATETGGI